ncbi:MAG: hypothetical protein AB9919_13930 [Geobacteraceae bacterium]
MRDISLDNLLAFYDNPARYLLRTRIGIRLDDLAPPFEDREPFGLEPLDAYQVRREMLEQVLAGRATDGLLALTRAKGILPPARQGDLLFRGLETEVTDFAAGIRSLTDEQPALEPLELELKIAGFRVSGRLAGVSARSAAAQPLCQTFRT